MAEDTRGQEALSNSVRLREVLRYGGLWEALEGPEGNAVPSCTIIPIADNDFLTPIHNRMTGILFPEEGLWLDTNLDDADSLTGILVPYPNEAMNACRVSTMVNYAGNDDPVVIARAR